MMETLIPILEAATGLPVKPFGTDKVEPCLCYKSYCSSDDGCVAQYRLELRLITDTIKEAETAGRELKAALIHLGDSSPVDGLSIEQNGGGQLEDLETATVHTLFYFIVTKRSEVHA